MTDAPLPRLLYVGDVPVEATYHGSALLYRLLQRYPAERLCILETAGRSVMPDRRLPGVRYRFLAHGKTRWLNTRFFRWYSLSLALRAPWLASRVADAIGDFEPEAVVTLAHGSLWMAAAAFARQRRLPLHVIVHDDAPWMAALPPMFAPRIDARFGRVYRAAASRLCVSPSMVEAYQRRHGATGEVLYPSRAADAAVFGAPPERVRERGRGLVFAFAGTTENLGSCRLLRALADALAPHQGELLIFGPLTASEAGPAGLDRPNIRLGGMLPSNDLIARLREEVDVLYVPMSFAPKDQVNMVLSFPSKLTDYTAVGLPLLIQGPPTCSAVRWATDNPGVAEVVASEDPAAVSAAVARLGSDPDRRMDLAQTAQRIGERDFSAAAAWQRFASAVKAGGSTARIT